MNEAALERKCVQRFKEYYPDGLALKLADTGMVGAPDRLFIGKRWVWFVEFKVPDGVVSAVQERVIRLLKDELCHHVSVIRSFDEFAEEIARKVVKERIDTDNLTWKR